VNLVLDVTAARRHSGDVALDTLRTFSRLEEGHKVVVVHPLGGDPAEPAGVGRRNRRNEGEKVRLRQVPGSAGDPAKRHCSLFGFCSAGKFQNFIFWKKRKKFLILSLRCPQVRESVFVFLSRRRLPNFAGKKKLGRRRRKAAKKNIVGSSKEKRESVLKKKIDF
jgi:hypothetical protein